MPFKDRLKKTFGKKSGTASGDSTRSTSEEYSYTGRKDVEYYKPHEIPKSKYRGKVDPEHKEHLESFCFNDAFSSSLRKKPSLALSGIMSPGGTKSQSRRASYVSEIGDNTRSSSSTLDTQEINTSSTSSEEDISNSFDTGLSREETLKPVMRSSTCASEVKTKPSEGAVKYTEVITPPNNQPFTIDELERAMTQVTVRPNYDTERRTSLAIPVC